MDQHQYLNELFVKKDKIQLQELFDVNNSNVTVFLQDINFKNIVPPYNEIVQNHKELLCLPSFKKALDVLKSVINVDLANRCIKQIIKNILLVRNHEESECKKKVNSGQTWNEFNVLDKEFKNVVFNMFKMAVRKNNGLSTYLCNIICMLHLKNKNYVFIADLVRLNVTDKKNKDYYIFMFYYGMSLIYNEEFNKGFSCLMVSLRLKEIHKHIFPIVFAVSLLKFNTQITNNKYLESLGFLKDGTEVYEYSSACLSLRSCVENNALDCSDSLCTTETLSSLLKVREIMRNGFVDILEKSTPYSFYIESHLTRIMQIYMPLVCFRNLLYRFYMASEQMSKLPINEIIAFCNMESAEVYCIILNCIDKGLVRGYLSINKNILVMSKETPFPDLLSNN